MADMPARRRAENNGEDENGFDTDGDLGVEREEDEGFETDHDVKAPIERDWERSEEGFDTEQQA